MKILVDLKEKYSQKDWLGIINIANSTNFSTLMNCQKTPIKTQGLLMVGRAYINLKCYDRATSFLENIIQLEPNHEKTLQLLCSIYHRSKRYFETIDLFETTNIILGDLKSLNYVGIAYLNTLQYDKAQNIYLQIINKYPESTIGYEGLIKIAWNQKSYATIINLDVDKYNIHMYSFFYKSYMYLGKYDELIKYLNIMLEKHNNLEDYYTALYQTYLHQKDFGKVIELFNRWEKVDSIQYKVAFFSFKNKFLNCNLCYLIEDNIEFICTNYSLLRQIIQVLYNNQDKKTYFRLVNKVDLNNPLFSNLIGYWNRIFFLKDLESQNTLWNISILEIDEYYLEFYLANLDDSLASLSLVSYIKNRSREQLLFTLITFFCREKSITANQCINLVRSLCLYHLFSHTTYILDIIYSRFPKNYLGYLIEMEYLEKQCQWELLYNKSKIMIERFPDFWKGYYYFYIASLYKGQYEKCYELLSYIQNHYNNIHLLDKEFKKIKYFQKYERVYKFSFNKLNYNKRKYYKQGDKIKLFAIARNEAFNIPAWVHHHLYFGFDEIEIWINRSNDNSIDICEKISNQYPNFIFKVVDDLVTELHSINLNFQATAYMINYLTLFQKSKKFNYIMFLDLDEYLTPKNFDDNIKNLLTKMPLSGAISFPWMIKHPQISRTSIQNINTAIFNKKNQLSKHFAVKTITRLSTSIQWFNPHTPYMDRTGKENMYFVTGERMKFESVFPYNVSTIASPSLLSKTNTFHEWFVVHDIYKSPIEYLSSLSRGEEYYIQEKSHSFALKASRKGYNYKDEKIPFMEYTIEITKLNNYNYSMGSFLSRCDITDYNLELASQLTKQRAQYVLDALHNQPKLKQLRMFNGLTYFF